MLYESSIRAQRKNCPSEYPALIILWTYHFGFK